MFLEFFTHR